MAVEGQQGHFLWSNGRLPRRDYRSKSSFYDLKQWVNKSGVLVCCCWQHLCQKCFVDALFELNETVWRAVSWHFLIFMHLWTSWIHIHSFWHALHVLLWGMKVFKTVQWQGRDDERVVQVKINWKWSAMQTRPTTQSEQRSTVDSNLCEYLQTRKLYCSVVALLGDLIMIYLQNILCLCWFS